jgi:hypothetical protein
VDDRRFLNWLEAQMRRGVDDLRHLEDDIAAVTHHLRADLDQLSAFFKLVSDQSLIGSGVVSVPLLTTVPYHCRRRKGGWRLLQAVTMRRLD